MDVTLDGSTTTQRWRGHERLLDRFGERGVEVDGPESPGFVLCPSAR